MLYDVGSGMSCLSNATLPVCFFICSSVCVQHSMSPHSIPDCRFWQFSVGVQCSPPQLDPAPAFWPHSFCPTVGEDISIGYLSSLWQWSVLMDTPELEDTQRASGLKFCRQSLHEICWNCFCWRQVVLLKNLPYPWWLFTPERQHTDKKVAS